MRRPPPPCCVRRSAARLPQRVRRMACDAPTSGASGGRDQRPSCAPPCCVRRSAARLPQRVRRMACDAPTSGASGGRDQRPSCANQQQLVGLPSCIQQRNNLRRVAANRSAVMRDKRTSLAGTNSDEGGGGGGDKRRPKSYFQNPPPMLNTLSSVSVRESRIQTCVTLNGSGIQLAVGPQPLWLRNHNSGLAHRIMYGPFNPYIPIRSTTIGKSRVAKDPIAMHTSWRSNSDIASVTRVSMTFRVVRTNQYNQDLGLIHSTKGNHLESPNEGSSIDHQVTIYLHAQNITMFPTNETWYFASQILVSSSGGLILILTAQSTRNMFRIHNDY
ncbi:triacylglycerol lipase [Dorcoceras hygrometricum]|uniref:Triacylglycerol lipase n=1 Tax=Dorcoceras hygrometricum TaxID=472368 RepID=A0A2Z7D8B8_9LAMI|nr:triacylglycerol lipase [Dorcoceras hygrometricum]